MGANCILNPRTVKYKSWNKKGFTVFITYSVYIHYVFITYYIFITLDYVMSERYRNNITVSPFHLNPNPSIWYYNLSNNISEQCQYKNKLACLHFIHETTEAHISQSCCCCYLLLQQVHGITLSWYDATTKIRPFALAVNNYRTW